jgi:hypothetical protein
VTTIVIGTHGFASKLHPPLRPAVKKNIVLFKATF